MSADDSVFVATCPIVGTSRVAIAHKETILLTTGPDASITIPTGHNVRAMGFVAIPESASIATQTAAKNVVEGVTTAGTPAADAASASSYIVTGGDDKSLVLFHVNSATGKVSVADTHGPVGKKVSHLVVVPTKADAPFSALVAKAPTGITPYCPVPTGTFATREAPSVALQDNNADKDDEENDDNNVKMSGLSAKDGYAVVAGRYYPNQIANVIFGNKFGEVYAIALLQTPTGIVFGPAPVFLLQHFSVLSAVSLIGYKPTDVNASTARIITCDRDAHTRVSKFPAAFEIEQFLWAPYVAPKEGEERQKQQDPIAAVVGTEDAKMLYTGDTTGRVSQWVAYAVEGEDSTKKQSQQWKLKDMFDFELSPVAEGKTAPINHGGVVGLALLKDGTLLVARDHVGTLDAVRAPEDGSDSYVTGSVALPTSSPIIQITATADGSAAVALTRDGAAYTVDAALAFKPLVKLPSAGSLPTVDLYYAWKSQFAENKQRRDEERNMSDERNKTNPKTNDNNKREKKKGGSKTE